MMEPLNDQASALESRRTELQRQWVDTGCHLGSRPRRGYTHPWKFLPEPLFRLADRFRFFGVYDVVDARGQYYTVTPLSATDEAALRAGESGAWVDDFETNPAKKLAVRGYTFRLAWMRLPWLPNLAEIHALLLGLLIVAFRKLLGDRSPGAEFTSLIQERKVPSSLFNPGNRLRIVWRGSQWIAMHWDKKDDDLMPFGLPMTVELESRQGPELTTRGGRARITVQRNEWVEQAPAVRLAYVTWQAAPTSSDTRAAIGFVSARPQGGLQNVWRIRIAALVLGRPDATVPVLTLEMLAGRFAQIADDTYEYAWTPTASELAALRTYCTRQGVSAHGTSLWVEDVVGHVNVPDEVRWLHPDEKVFRSFNYRDHCVRHEAALGALARPVRETDALASTFSIVRGLAGRGISFESVDRRGHYLRHQGSRVALHPLQDTQTFRGEATFHVRPGLANAAWTSFEADSYPGAFIRHKSFALWVERPGGDLALFNADATFGALPRAGAMAPASSSSSGGPTSAGGGSVGSAARTTGIGAGQL
jgi:hypothetical protein